MTRTTRPPSPDPARARTAALGLTVLVGLVLGGTLGCGQQKKDLLAYMEAMAAIAPDNKALVADYTVLSRTGTKDPAASAERIEKDILPRAQEIQNRLRAVPVPDDGIAEIHQLAISAYTIRIAAYGVAVKTFRGEQSAKNLAYEQHIQGDLKLWQWWDDLYDIISRHRINASDEHRELYETVRSWKEQSQSRANLQDYVR